jgi:hypothetical protein
MKPEVKLDHYFDAKRNRHYLNGILSVLHCHHYATLYTQLAIDSGETELLKESARDAFREVLDKYFQDHPEIEDMEEKIDVACEYYSMLGLGGMHLVFLGEDSGEVDVPSAHIDSGWLKKWGEYHKPVNYITAGYVEAMFEAVLNTPARSFEAVETQSIVMGADTSKFRVVRR